MNKMQVKEIDSISFGIMSAEEIRQISAFEVKVAKISNNNLYETVHDPRSGPIGSAPCETCHQNEWDCPGHFGHIELNVPIIHPLFISHVVNILKIFCWNCNEFMLTHYHLKLNNILKLEKEKRFDAILEKVKKCNKCYHCNSIKKDYKWAPNDLTYKTIYRTTSGQVKRGSTNQEEKEIVSAEMVKKIFDNIKLEYVEMLGMSHPKDYCLTVFPVIPSCCRPHEVQDGNINDDDLTYQITEIVKNNLTIGIIQCKQKKLEKQFTEEQKKKLDNIIKKRTGGKNKHEDIIEEYLSNQENYIKAINNLKFRIETYCNNSQGKATHATTGRAIKGLRERLTRKEGQIRNNLLGKRCEFSGRTVVGPDPLLKIDEMILPDEMAQSLSVPVIVNKYNISELTTIVNNEKAIRLVKKDINSEKEIRINLAAAINNRGTPLQHEDTIYRLKYFKNETLDKNEKKSIEKLNEDKNYNRIIIRDPKNFKLKKGDVLVRNKVIYENLTMPSKNFITLKEGWVVHRHLKNGDVVFLNRQPTLHKPSMMAVKIKTSPIKTIKINLACAKPYNADFDGDEMNLHVPQSEDSKAELLMLSTPKQCLISSQAGKPNLTIVQDSLTGAYLMSKENNNDITVTIGQFNDILMVLTTEDDSNSIDYFLKRKEEISETLKKLGFSGHVRNGRGLLSLLLPKDLFIDDSDLKITRGVIHKGFLSKKYLSSTETSLIKIIFKEYGVETCSTFLNNIQFLTNAWLMISSFSIHAGDCIKQKEVIGTVEQCLMESEKIKMTTKNPFIREQKIMQALSNAKDIGMKIAKDALKRDNDNPHDQNNFITTVESGSKGDYFNIAQITGLLGQQNKEGQRIKPVLNNATRTLPHYLFPADASEDTPGEKAQFHGLIEEYESQGFISSSFAQGLNPKEFFFHCMAGRQGVCDTAMSTATSGYIMRRSVKLTEDIQVKYDGTVQDTHGRRYQMAYGGLGYDPSKMVKVKGKSEICNVSRLVNKLNSNYENQAITIKQ
jgi:DNA-directed RNA polymerase beta' subunit